VPGPLERSFSYRAGSPFAAGQRRGVVLAARPGARVASACSGVVAFAGSVARRTAVSVRCGRWHVAYGGVRTPHRPGARVRGGRLLGRVAGRGGIHLSVRRAADRFAYVDPMRLLPAPALPPPPPPAPLAAPRPSAPPAPAPPRPAPRATRPAPLASPPAPLASPPARPVLAPWPVWLGLALLLAGAGTSVCAARGGGGRSVWRRGRGRGRGRGSRAGGHVKRARAS